MATALAGHGFAVAGGSVTVLELIGRGAIVPAAAPATLLLVMAVAAVVSVLRESWGADPYGRVPPLKGPVPCTLHEPKPRVDETIRVSLSIFWSRATISGARVSGCGPARRGPETSRDGRGVPRPGATAGR
jgi:hypothetical protein